MPSFHTSGEEPIKLFSIENLIFNLQEKQQIEEKEMRTEPLPTLIITILIASTNGIDLGENLLVNSYFSQPRMNSGSSWQDFSSSIPGWQCTKTCQLDDCSISLNQWSSRSIVFGNCDDQVLDVSSSQIEAVTQLFEAHEGDHQLIISFLLPLDIPNTAGKTLLVYFNSLKIFQYQPLFYGELQALNFTGIVKAVVGTNNITITQAGLNDYFGFRLVSVVCQRIKDLSAEKAIQSLFESEITQNIMGLPGLRFILGTLLNVFISFDRMQLYYYHDRKYSYYTNMFFSNIASLMDMKGDLSIRAITAAYGNGITSEQTALSSLDYKYSYIDQQVISKSDNGYGFILNNVNLIVYSIPYFIASLAVFYVLFRLTFNYMVSKILRRFSFICIAFVLLVCEGNIEQYSFYVFGEFTTFFYQNMRHKMVNCFIIFFFFMVISTSVGLYFWLLGNRRKQTKYFTENTKKSLMGIFCYTFDRGLICIVFGVVHQLLIPFPNLQLLVLGLIQVTWIGFQVLGLKRKVYENSLLVWLNIIQGLNRILFQLTLYLYSKAVHSAQDSSFLNEQIHLKQIFIFIGIWIVGFCLSFLLFCMQLTKFWSKRKIHSLLDKKYQSKHSRPKEKQTTYYLRFRRGKLQIIHKSQHRL